MEILEYIFAILLVIGGVLWWALLVIRPIFKAIRHKETPSVISLVAVAITICSIRYSLMFGGYVLVFSFLIAIISPPAMMFIGLVLAIDFSFWTFVVSFVVLVLACVVLLNKTAGKLRVIVALVSIAPFCALPLIAESYISTAKIRHEFERIGGDCLSVGTFDHSLKIYGSLDVRFHAVVVKNETALIWSYSKQEFVPSSLGTKATLSFAPTGECRI